MCPVVLNMSELKLGLEAINAHHIPLNKIHKISPKKPAVPFSWNFSAFIENDFCNFPPLIGYSY